MADSILRNRRIYGQVFREVLIMLHGFGVETNRVEIERIPSADARVRWDVIVDDKVFFEELTIEEISSALKGMMMAKILVREAVKTEKLNVNTFDNVPTEKAISSAIARSFDREFADMIVPAAANHNNHNVIRVAASQTTPERPKNPARVEAGRRAAARRWSTEAPANA